MNKRVLAFAIVPTLALVVGTLVLSRMSRSPGSPRTSLYESRLARKAESLRWKADALYSQKKYSDAKRAYERIVAEFASLDDPELQDEVGAARIRLGHVVAETEGFAAARIYFAEAESEYAGTGATGADFGGIPDQAAYQAAVCLQADDKTEEAVEALSQFLRRHSGSPLVHAAYRRLARLDPEREPAHRATLEEAIAAQEQKVQAALASCGPRAIIELCDRLAVPKPEFARISTVCGTDQNGTTMSGMRKGLESLGLRATGRSLNRRDFGALVLPAIWLMGDHYVVLTKVEGDVAQAFDPMIDAERRFKLPPQDDLDFTAAILIIDLPQAGNHP
ncbi:MAG: tetratricopeptide repeat protein [Nitrospirae bacterium]|nr:tetratricopeptide repeat protein [Fimbriimonadaceae bacterium]